MSNQAQQQKRIVSKLFFSSDTTTTTTTNNNNHRPFQILGLQQIAIGSLDKSSLSHLWQDIFGIPKVGSYKSEKENVDEDILRLGGPPLPEEEEEEDASHKDGSAEAFSVEIDLMTPLDPDSSPKVHSPALNHIGLWVDDLPSAVAWMKKQ
eukprot:14269049-Ditylum_brightwellii.AAC.1